MCARLRAYELRVTSVDYVVDLGKSPDPRRPHPRSTAIPKRKSSGETGPHAPPPSRTSRGARVRAGAGLQQETIQFTRVHSCRATVNGLGREGYFMRTPATRAARAIPATSLQHHSGARPHQYKTTFALLTLCGAALGTLNLAARTHPATKTLDHALDGKSRRLSRTWWQGMGGETRLACTCAQWQAAHFQR